MWWLPERQNLPAYHLKEATATLVWNRHIAVQCRRTLRRKYTPEPTGRRWCGSAACAKRALPAGLERGTTPLADITRMMLPATGNR